MMVGKGNSLDTAAASHLTSNIIRTAGFHYAYLAERDVYPTLYDLSLNVKPITLVF